MQNGTQLTMGREGSISFINKLFYYLFYTQTFLISLLAIFLTLRGLLLPTYAHHFHPKKWYFPVLSSIACAALVGYVWQAFTSFNPSRTFKTIFWLSPLLTCGYGILLVSIGTPWSLATSLLPLVSSVLQSIYACWVIPRLEHAISILKVSIAYNPPKVKAMVFISIVTCTLYSSLLISGVGGATINKTKLDIIFIFVILGSLTWTMQITKNMIQVAVSHIKYTNFTSGIEKVDLSEVVKDTFKYSMGNICIGSILVPIICVIRGLARGVSLISGDVDEFMFSCANCCAGVASSIVIYGNRYGFVYVGVYNKGIVQASRDTWEMFRRVENMENLIDSDLTSSFCFLCGMATGSICAMVGGTWTLFIQKSYATEVSIYTFFVGYFMSRVGMAWIQASIAAYYVVYAENPQSRQFDNNVVQGYIQKLRRLHDKF